MSRYSLQTIPRREYLVTVGAVVGSAGLAGCSGSSNVDGELVVQQTVTDGQEKFEFESQEGDSIDIYMEKREGPLTTATLLAPLSNQVAMEEIEGETTVSHSVQDGGLFILEVWQAGSDGEVYVEVGIES